LQQLHTYGLLTASFRHRGIIILRRFSDIANVGARGSTCIQRIQKALTEMNLQLANVISDISGTTGLRILRAIVEENGIRSDWLYARLAHQGTPDEVAKACWKLAGRADLVVGENLALYEVYNRRSSVAISN